MTVLKFKIYILEQLHVRLVWKNNDLKLNNRIKQVLVEVKNIIIELKTSSGSDNDKYNKHHKYTLDEALQSVLEFNDKSDYSDLSD